RQNLAGDLIRAACRHHRLEERQCESGPETFDERPPRERAIPDKGHYQPPPGPGVPSPPCGGFDSASRAAAALTDAAAVFWPTGGPRVAFIRKSSLIATASMRPRRR